MMQSKPIIIICGNTDCGKRLQINRPEKFNGKVKCPNCGHLNALPLPSEIPGEAPEDDAPTRIGTAFQAPPRPVVPGWLIIKDELTPTRTYALHEGMNTIGRKSAQHPPAHVIDSSDARISRPHCTIEVRVNRLGLLEYVLYDGALLPDSSLKSSLNGTYLNGHPQRLSPHDRIHLKDGDTLQVGVTKLVLKTGYSAATLEEATREVEKLPYQPTVTVEK